LRRRFVAVHDVLVHAIINLFGVVQDVREMRKSTSAVQKIGFARECKNAGSNYFRDAEYDAAINEYERCLSMLDWVEPTDPDWKKKVTLLSLMLRRAPVSNLFSLQFVLHRVFRTNCFWKRIITEKMPRTLWKLQRRSAS
jgi:hypothetical protein